MNEVKLKAFELSMEISRLPKPSSPNGMGGYSSSPPESIDVILTRAAMIEKFLLG